MAKKIKKEEMLKAIQGSGAIISKIQKKLQKARNENISWATTKANIEKWPETKKAYDEEKESVLDFAENNIQEAIILEKDKQMSKWYLMMKGKDRGYEQNNTLQLANDEPLNINFEGMTREQLKVADNVEIGGLNEESAAD